MKEKVTAYGQAIRLFPCEVLGHNAHAQEVGWQGHRRAPTRGSWMGGKAARGRALGSSESQPPA